MIRYFDSSALAKRCLAEDGSASVADWFVGGTPATSRIALLEVTSAVGRRGRSGRISGQEVDLALAILAEDAKEILFVGADDRVVERARPLVLEHGLRAADALHLASALHLRERSGRPVVLVSWDADLLRAARAEGLRTLGGA